MEDLGLDKNRFIVQYLHKLGFDADAAKLYIALLKKGPTTITELSRRAKIERTKIYRIIENLKDKGLIEVISEFKRKVLKASDIHRIDLLLEKEKLKVDSLNDSFPLFRKVVQSYGAQTAETQVLYYRGQDGIRQMLWNELNAKGESLCYLYKIFDIYVGSRFFEHWADEFEKRKLSSREIRTEIFDQSYEECPNETCFHMKRVEMRYMDSTHFPLTHGMTIYNNVVAIYNWWQDEVFGVEIYNQQVAEFQRFTFETFWKMAESRPEKHIHKKKVQQY